MTDELKQWEYDRGYEKGKADVLDKIRAEIEEKYNDSTTYVACGLGEALDIIDKYRKGEDE